MNQLPTNKTMFGHPAGLFLLFGTELWERFSYYAMRAILVLYLVDKAHGLGWSEADALSLYGTFTMLVYLTPLIGGWLADNIIGQRKAILIGGTLMAAGQFTLAAPHAWIPGAEVTVFYIGLGLLVMGNGLFKPNISTMVGDLYEEGDHRRDGAFTIFYMGINVGAFLSGIIVGTVVAAAGGSWQAGFACAGVGMVLSLLIQMTFAQRLLGDIGKVPSAKLSKQQQTEERKSPLTSEEFDRIKVIFILGVFTIIFWAGFEQAGGLMNIYADRYTERMVGSFEVPTAWFQSVNAFFIVLCAPIIAVIWTRMGDKEPTSPVKFALALILLAIGFVFMIGATIQQGGDTSVKTSMMWLIAAYFFHTLGELCLSPIGLSMVTKLAPLRLASVLMGTWFFFTGLANYVAGFVGSFIGHGDESNMVDNAMSIFAGIAITSVVSAIILFLMADKLVYWMHGAEGQQHDKLEEELEGAAEHQ
ncbi:peptide MFS transporter [Echinimonas agarilytica]|uniref:Peptide MFS transporter n=1 Tax=Echinimonas agarilytica TaxID=1215918 RepID=A0AA41W5Y6_9GAMM|nr:peptide MFS transporter [Echinimonas agarilytica]MCM2679500.1 peptide MFS transporter [Echinimonas agarilytica]